MQTTAVTPPLGRELLLPKAGAQGHAPPGSQDAEAGKGGNSERQLGPESVPGLFVFLNKFIFGCVGSSLLCAGFL